MYQVHAVFNSTVNKNKLVHSTYVCSSLEYFASAVFEIYELNGSITSIDRQQYVCPATLSGLGKEYRYVPIKEEL